MTEMIPVIIKSIPIEWNKVRGVPFKIKDKIVVIGAPIDMIQAAVVNLIYFNPL